MKIIGLDVSGGYATAIFLQEKPDNLIEYARSEEFAPFEIQPNEKSLNAIASLGADLIVLEPSGGHYERIFCNWFNKKEIPWRRVVGHRIDAYRRDQGLDKTDNLDALALAAYGYDKLNDKRAWIEECELPRLRELCLQRYALIKMQKRYIQRLRLQLEHEFPEAASATIHREWGESTNGIISWMIEKKIKSGYSYNYWEKQYKGGIKNATSKNTEMVSPTIGTGLSNHSKNLAKHINELWLEISEIEAECDRIMSDNDVKPYLDACLEIGFNKELTSIWLTRIYPFKRFMDAEGKERRVKRRSSSGKTVTHNLSLSQFKASVGAGTIRNESGTRQVAKKNARRGWQNRKKMERAEYVSGDMHSRRAYFMWFMGKVNLQRNRKSKTEPSPELKQIRERNQKLTEKSRNIYLRGCNCHGYTAKLLYRKLKSRIN